MRCFAAGVCFFALLCGPASPSSALPVSAPGHTGAAAPLDPTDLAPDPTAVALSAEANATAQAWNINATAGPGGAISPSGNVVVTQGADQTFDVLPDSCDRIAYVLVDGVSVGPITSYTFYNVSANHTIVANFAPTAWTITASAGLGGSITPSGTVRVNCGSDQSFTITPAACFHLLNVVVDGVSHGAIASYTFVNVTSPHTIAASFEINAEIITASAGPGGSISPAAAVGVNCGSNQSFTIAPDACHHVADVVVDGVSQGPITSYTFYNVTSPHSIAASFDFDATSTYTITASSFGGGSINPAGDVVVQCGADQTFTFTPAACFRVLSVLVDGVWQGAMTSYTFHNVTANHTILASFADVATIFVMGSYCTQTEVRPYPQGEGLGASTTYRVDVRPTLDCLAPAAGSPLGNAGSVTTDSSGVIAQSSLGCYSSGSYLLIVDALANGVYDPGCDPLVCFATDLVEVNARIQDLEATIAPEGPTLTWWVTELDAYRGFLVHRAPEGGAEALVTPEALTLTATRAPAQMRWRDATAAPGTRYAYRIEALKAVGSDWYGPVTLTVPVVPRELALRDATPNPFHGATRLAVEVPFGAGQVRLEVFDVAGRRVRELYQGALAPGEDVVRWDGRDEHGTVVRGGVYLVRLESALGMRIAHVVKVD